MHDITPMPSLRHPGTDPRMKIPNLCSMDTGVSQRWSSFMKTSLSKVVQKNAQKILAGLVVIKFELFRIREHDIIHATCVLCSTLDEDIFDNSEMFLVQPGP